MNVFLDSNILLYALGDEEPKRERARALLATLPTISTQVINECSHVLRRKAGWTPAQVAMELPVMMRMTRIVDVHLAHIHSAWQLSERYGYSHFDSLIIAAALDAGCQSVYTEDMQHGQIIDQKLTLLNPFIMATL